MSSPNLLSREDLIALWSDMAESCGTQLQLPVNNGVSLVLKFDFENDFGSTEVKISDLASHGSSWTGQGSQMGTTITTSLTSPLGFDFKVTLPPFFPSLMLRIFKDATIIHTQEQAYWFRCSSRQMREQLVEGPFNKLLDEFRFFSASGGENQVETRTNTYMGKKEEITAFLEHHYRVLQLLTN